MRIILSNFRYYLLPGLDFEKSTLRALTLPPPLLTNDHSHEVQFARRESRVHRWPRRNRNVYRRRLKGGGLAPSSARAEQRDTRCRGCSRFQVDWLGSLAATRFDVRRETDDERLHPTSMDATWRGSCVALPALPSLLENSPLLFSFLSFFNKVRDETWKFAIFKTDIAVSRSPRTRSSVRFAWRCLDFESDDFVLYVESWNNIFSIPTVLRVFDDWTKKQLH